MVRRARSGRKVVPLDRPVQVSRADAPVTDMGNRTITVARAPAEFSLEIEEYPSTPLQQAKTHMFKPRRPK